MEWISVKDRFPEQHKEVLISIEYGDIIQANYSGNRWYISRDVRDNATDCYASLAQLTNDSNVTHWMPLPPAPKQ